MVASSSEDIEVGDEYAYLAVCINGTLNNSRLLADFTPYIFRLIFTATIDNKEIMSTIEHFILIFLHKIIIGKREKIKTIIPSLRNNIDTIDKIESEMNLFLLVSPRRII